MPGFDGKGPMGQGAMTGWGRGFCAVSLNESGEKPFFGAGYHGKGRGRGFRNCFYATGVPGWMRAQKGMRGYGVVRAAASKEDKLTMLKEQVDFLKKELESDERLISELEKEQGNE